MNLNIDFSDSNFENFEITTSALCISTQTTQSLRIKTFSSARMNQLANLKLPPPLHFPADSENGHDPITDSLNTKR
jgi:hypothetical protein